MVFSYALAKEKEIKIKEKISLLKNVMLESNVKIVETKEISLPNNMKLSYKDKSGFYIQYFLIGCSKYESSTYGYVNVLYCNDYIFAYRMHYESVAYWLQFADLKDKILSGELTSNITDAIGEDDVNLPGYFLIGYNGFDDDSDALYKFNIDVCSELGLDNTSIEEIRSNLDVLGEINELVEKVNTTIIEEDIYKLSFEKKISIGIDDFKKLMDNNTYYVDKSNLICDLIDNCNQATLITRPRRFGKSLNMSMLKYFFEKTDEDNSYLFKNLNVFQNEKYMKHQGKYPVISISLGSLKLSSFDDCIEKFSELIADEFEYQTKGIDFTKLSKREVIKWNKFVNTEASTTSLTEAILFLSKCLEKFYNEKVIILIDEYDVPLDNAYFYGFYDKMINFIRLLFESAIKGNSSLNMAVLTGCLRISKESIFTGMNNLAVYSVTDKKYSSYYGFTEQEVKNMLKYYNLQDKFETIKYWYDGYLYGDNEIYNPWSVLNYVSNLLEDKNIEPMPYWSNSSSNNIIHKLILNSNREIKNDIETLINRESINKPLYDNITYPDIETNKPTIWSFLLHTGYLKLVNSSRNPQTFNLSGNFVIPNIEVLTIFNDEIRKWTDEILRKSDNTHIFNAILQRNVAIFEKDLNNWLIKTISYHDVKEKESFYHGLLLGLLSNFDNYEVKSNRESGNGRFDIVLKDYQYQNVIILELKVADNQNQLENECDDALKQIETKQYDVDFKSYKNIIKYGIAFYNKCCKIKM